MPAREGFGALECTHESLGLAGVSATAIAAHWVNTCALMAGGGVKCWGYNDYGQLGIGSTVQQYSPVNVALGSGWRVNFEANSDRNSVPKRIGYS